MMAERELATWQELAALIAEHHLAPDFSSATGRAYVTYAGECVWARVGDATLTPTVPGANVLQHARICRWSADMDAERARYLATLTPEELERDRAERRRVQAILDPPEWQIERYLEQHGR